MEETWLHVWLLRHNFSKSAFHFGPLWRRSCFSKVTAKSQICSHCCSISKSNSSKSDMFLESHCISDLKVRSAVTVALSISKSNSSPLNLQKWPHIWLSLLLYIPNSVASWLLRNTFSKVSLPLLRKQFSPAFQWRVIFLVESQLYSGELTLEEHILKSQHATTLAKIFVPQESARHWKADFWEAFNIFVPSESARP